MNKKADSSENVVKLKQGSSADAPARRKGIYLLPNLLTTGALFAGFYAVLSGFTGQFELAAIAIFAAMIFDGLDGRVARMTNTQSDFGVQYDSLSDMVSFGVAPAVVAYGWGVSDLGKLGLAAAFVYASCAALRLARFNVQAESSDGKVFTGLPSPAAAALVAGFVWSTYELAPSVALSVLGAVLTAAAGLLMVSNFKYPSFKEVDLRGKVPFIVILSVVMGFVVITIDPPRILFMLAVFFSFSAPLIWLAKKLGFSASPKAD
ncbi:CDP-diacylglycerol--serine O-phosphatidyltransferase [Porticoccaceae bacterium]|jgi:CDP-diacylglycerol--serine O-phosphatidyltransferase|nr:CDP-diacylglycerol--serine O-phosphatidyltransferase [Porticoccaceae bacterium]MBT7904564.1 CDP-diacylglycerol--serine O-phosphatidyltransferase [Porticoccaceae bacterium]MDA8734562.1 CDP-diacylglycerol--serine O-phosphatidyltransferase [Porticoccaceae bacterium]MDA9565799.1 CDP-diacylglycerol--serine O-phosphatidyltransferase [Porticoccaceae bacterium]MDA9839855.1 CDP-diacylglycerol--serine O-phosphatidyltransferase [Porticoccaceae bacterium]